MAYKKIVSDPNRIVQLLRIESQDIMRITSVAAFLFLVIGLMHIFEIASARRKTLKN